MSKILYGVSGEGFGHAARSKEIISYLISKKHQVRVISYDRGFDFLSQFFDTEKIFGLKFTYKKNQVHYLETMFDNLLKTPQAAKSLEKVKKITDDFKPDIVFTDFEPLSCIVANLRKIPLISVDNQHILTRSDAKYPLRYKGEAMVAKLVTRLLIFKAKSYLILSFFNAKASEDRTIILPPVVRKEVLKLTPHRGDYILVYFTSVADNVIEALKKSKKRFVVYGLNKKTDEGLISYRLYDQKNFLRDLSGARAIVANAGFSLISEALYLGKPYLAIPAKSQFEQVLNAYQLGKSGYGDWIKELTSAKIKDFERKLPVFEKKLANYPRQDNKVVFVEIDKILKSFKK